MVSLSTVYGLTIVLGTIAAIGSAFVGSKIYPIQAGGTIEMALAPAAAILPAVTAALKSATPGEEPLEAEVETPLLPDIGDLKSRIAKEFDGNEEVAELIVLFLKTPVKDWKLIADDLSGINQKFRDSMTHPNMNKCPASILKVCQLAAKKYSNIRDYIQTESLNELGDQTEEAYKTITQEEAAPVGGKRVPSWFKRRH